MSENTKPNDKTLRRHDSNVSIISKCGSWSLGSDVKSNPMLEAMGLSFLPDATEEKDDSESDVSSSSILSTSPFADMSVNERVLQTLSSNINESVLNFHNEQINEDFFVFKRRRLNSVSGEDKINRLHDEHLLYIFQFLPKYMLARCAQVCKRWKRICFDETLWRRLDLGGKTLKPGVIGRVLLRGSKILRLAKAEISSPAFCPQLHHLSRNLDIQCKLTHIDLSMAAIDVSALEEIFSLCLLLQKVSLELCTITNQLCEYISKSTFLDTLNMAMCYNLRGEGLISILKGCSRLQVLNVAWADFKESELNDICSSLPHNLIQLNISGCRNVMLDKHIMLIAKNCPKLIELDVSDSIKITGNSIAVVITRLQDVQSLGFSRCYGIVPKLYLELKNLPKLAYLAVYGIFSDSDLITVRSAMSTIGINKHMFSSVARPTVGIRRTSIWGQRVRDRFS